MADSECFDFVCDQLEQQTALDRLEARGTVRLALKAAGLEAPTVTPSQMAVVVDKLLPKELESRGISDPQAVCENLRSGLAGLDSSETADTPDRIFERLGGGA